MQTGRYLLALGSSCTLITLIGLGLLSVFRLRIDEARAAIFAALLAGLTFVITLYSLWATRGVTVNLGFIMLAGIALYFHRGNKSRQGSHWRGAFRHSEEFPALVVLAAEYLCVLLAIFLVQLYTVYGSGDPFFFLSRDLDRVLFSDLSVFLNFSGRETEQVDFLAPQQLGVSPYHFYELWITSALTSLTGLLSLIVSHLVTAPLAGLMVYAGMRALAERFAAPNPLKFVLCLAFTLANAEIFLPGPDRFHLLSLARYFVYDLSPVECPKYFPIYVFMLASALLITAGQRSLAAVVLLATPVASILAVPLIPALALAAVVGRKLGVLTKKEFWRIGAATAATGLFLAAFYVIFRQKVIVNRLPDSAELLAIMKTTKAVKTSINVFGGSIFQVLYAIAPYLLLCLACRGAVKKIRLNTGPAAQIAFLFVATLASGLAVYMLLHFKLEAHEPFVLLAHVILNIVALVTVLFLYQERRRTVLAFVFALLAVKAYEHGSRHVERRQAAKEFHSQAFLSAVAAKTSGLNSVGAYFIAPKDFSIRSKHTTCMFLSLIDSRFYPVNLSVLDMPMPEDPLARSNMKNTVQGTSFHKFVERQKAGSQFKGVARSQLDFLQQYHVGYVILGKGAALPPAMAPLVREAIKDEKSQETFVLLKPL